MFLAVGCRKRNENLSAGHKHSDQWFERQTRPQGAFEQFGACRLSGIKPGDVAKVEEFISNFIWYDTTPAIARQVRRWRYEYARRGVTLALPDTLNCGNSFQLWADLSHRKPKRLSHAGTINPLLNRSSLIPNKPRIFPAPPLPQKCAILKPH